LTEAPNFIKSKRKLIKASKPGDNDLEVVTLELDIDAAFKAIKLASELGRLSADMHTKKEQVDLTWDDIVPPSMDPDAAARHFAQILLGRIQNRGNRSGND
jgi:hypothetical protein